MFMLYFANAILLLLLHYIQKISPLHSSKIFNKTEQAVTMLFLLLLFFFNRRIFLFVSALMLGRKIFCLWSKYFQHDQLKLNCSVTKYSPQLACYKPWKLRLKSRHSKSAMPWLKVLNNIWNTNSFLWNRFELAIVFLCFLPLPILMVRKASQ